MRATGAVFIPLPCPPLPGCARSRAVEPEGLLLSRRPILLPQVCGSDVPGSVWGSDAPGLVCRSDAPGSVWGSDIPGSVWESDAPRPVMPPAGFESGRERLSGLMCLGSCRSPAQRKPGRLCPTAPSGWRHCCSAACPAVPTVHSLRLDLSRGRGSGPRRSVPAGAVQHTLRAGR